MKTPFVILTDGKNKEVVFEYKSARMAIIFSLTVINGVLPVVVLFSSAVLNPLDSWTRVLFVFMLLFFELLFFLVYYPLKLTLRIEPKALRIITVGPFYLSVRKELPYSKTPFLKGFSEDGAFSPSFTFFEGKKQHEIALFPYAENGFISSVPIFRKVLTKDEIELLGKELGIKTITAQA